MGLLFRPYYPVVRPAAGVETGQPIAEPAAAKRVPPVRVPRARHRRPRGDPLMSRLERLARLHQTGELNDWEFGLAKAKILRR